MPIGEMFLTEAVGREYKIDRVTIVHKDRLPRVRRRLGIGSTISELRHRTLGWDFFDEAQSFAVVRCTGSPEHVEVQSLKILREELSILAVSQLGYNQRRQMGSIVSPGEIESTFVTYFGANSTSPVFFGNLMQRTKPLNQTVMDGRWKNYQDKVFFTDFLKILRGEIHVTPSWKEDLRKVAILIGESIGARDLLKSFLWNWIALETLMSSGGDKVAEVLPKRIETLLGWARYSLEDPDATYWRLDDYHNRIQSVYQKRCGLVHRAERNDITEEDVSFTDHLLLNVLCNLVASPKTFKSKSALIDFSEKVEAERRLGIKPKVRPKDLRYIRSLPKARPKFKIQHRAGSWRGLPEWWRSETKLGSKVDTSTLAGSFFRVVNKGNAPATLSSPWLSCMNTSVWEINVDALDLQKTIGTNEAIVIYVPEYEMNSALQMHEIVEGSSVVFNIKDSYGKTYRKSFKHQASSARES